MAKSATAFKQGWFVRHSPRQTVHNIIAGGDLRFLKSLSVEQFESKLIDEVEFLAPYNATEIEHVKQYIHTNRDELYEYMRELASRK